MIRRALVTGASGQDGVLLARHLLACGYDVIALVRVASSELLATAACSPRLSVLAGDITDQESVRGAFMQARPHEVYNLAAVSSVAQSWRDVAEVMRVNVGGVANMLEEVRRYRDVVDEDVRFYQASSSEMFGRAISSPQNEHTPFNPNSPYAVSKVAAHQLTRTYRETYGLFASAGVLYNHESPLRPPSFVTRKIARGVAEISLGRSKRLTLGNIDVSRDWGDAADYVKAMRLMMCASEPDDYVIATGQSRSLREFLAAAFTSVGIVDWEAYVDSDPRFFRPAEVVNLVGDASKARRDLGWRPTTSFGELVERMVRADLSSFQGATHEDRHAGSPRGDGAT